MLRITKVENLEEIYHYQLGFAAPWLFPASFEQWKKSLEADTDGEGRKMFRELTLKAAYAEDKLVGFIQYGKTAFGFDSTGEISSDVSYRVIRNLYFDEGREDAGALLLQEALDALGPENTVYAFFHYFGMSCFARHGKLFEKYGHIEALLKKHGFETEHENVYYASSLKDGEKGEVTIAGQNVTKGNQQYMDFLLGGEQVGGCEVHYVDGQRAYLRWIYVNENLTGKGVGTRCMDALKPWLYEKGFRSLDTDTALSNTIAQHYYEKNGFTREGITRSFYRL